MKEAIPTVLMGGMTANRGLISSATRAAEQVLSESGSPVPPGADQVPTGTAGISERTKRLQIATGILVLPLLDPLRLAGEVIPALKDVHPPGGLSEELASLPPVSPEELQSARLGPAPSDVTT